MGSHSPDKVMRTLGKLDDLLGGRMAATYETIIGSNPALEPINVKVDAGTAGQFRPGIGGLGESSITITPMARTYQAFLEYGPTRARIGRFTNFFEERGIAIGVGELATGVLSHEFGHAEQLRQQIAYEGGNTVTARENMSLATTASINTLPLKRAPSQVWQGWRPEPVILVPVEPPFMYDLPKVPDGWPRETPKAGPMQTVNLPPSEVEFKNAIAYARLPMESDADDFSLAALARVYSAGEAEL